MKHMRHFRTLLFVALLTVAAGCSSGGSGGGGNSPPPPTACNADGQKQFVLEVMQDIYFWVDELPVVDLDDFATAEELLVALRFDPPDRFSSIDSAAADAAFFGAGQFVGLGFSTVLLAADDLRLTQVFVDGPAGRAGLQRGYRILEIDGRTIAEIEAAEGVGAAFGPRDIGFPVTLMYRDLLGVDTVATLFKDVVTIEPIPVSDVFTDVNGATVGYLNFRTFVETSFDRLDETFALFSSAGVEDLILDMRYNGGGLVVVAEYLGNLLGAGLDGEVFSSTLYNAGNTFRNRTALFRDQLNALDLNRIVVIATGSTASASELVVNSMIPFRDLTIVGRNTFGKPVGSLGFVFCEKIIRPISFETVNADGGGGYFDGLTADCPAADDLNFRLGDPNEASLAQALFFLENGFCAPVPIDPPIPAPLREKRALAPQPATGLRQLINAH